MGNLPFAHRVALMLTEIQIEDVTSEEDLKIVYRGPYVVDLFHLNDVFNPLYSGWFPTPLRRALTEFLDTPPAYGGVGHSSGLLCYNVDGFTR
jgi:hypothetical protein